MANDSVDITDTSQFDRIAYELKSRDSVVILNVSGAVMFRCPSEYTDRKVSEGVDAFVTRHGGVVRTGLYLQACAREWLADGTWCGMPAGTRVLESKWMPVDSAEHASERAVHLELDAEVRAWGYGRTVGEAVEAAVAACKANM